MGQYRDFQELWQQVHILQAPQNYTRDQYDLARQYCDNFVIHNVANLHEFFQMFGQIAQENT